SAARTSSMSRRRVASTGIGPKASRTWPVRHQRRSCAVPRSKGHPRRSRAERSSTAARNASIPSLTVTAERASAPGPASLPLPPAASRGGGVASPRKTRRSRGCEWSAIGRPDRTDARRPDRDARLFARSGLRRRRDAEDAVVGGGRAAAPVAVARQEVEVAAGPLDDRAEPAEAPAQQRLVGDDPAVAEREPAQLLPAQAREDEAAGPR